MRPYIFNEFKQFRVSIRNRVGKIDFCVLTSKIKLELKLIRCLACTIATQSFHKLDVIALILRPLIRFGSFLNYFRVRCHSFAIQISSFYNIADIELNSPNILFIANFKIIPIGMSLCICITSYKAVIFILFYSYCYIEVSTLEIGVKVYLVLSDYIQVLTILVFGQIFLCQANGVDCFSDEADFYFISFTVFPFIIIPSV